MTDFITEHRAREQANRAAARARHAAQQAETRAAQRAYRDHLLAQTPDQIERQAAAYCAAFRARLDADFAAGFTRD